MKRNIDRIKIAAPCPANWAEMIGNDKVRFCKSCSLNVYNLSAMTRDEAQAVLDGAKGRLCVRFYRRQDGRVLTQDCPIGKADRTKKTVGNLAAAAAVAAATVILTPQPEMEPMIGKASSPVPESGYTTGVVAPESDLVMGEVSKWAGDN